MSEHKIVIEHHIVVETSSLSPESLFVVRLDEMQSRADKARFSRFAQVNHVVFEALRNQGVQRLTEAQFHALVSLF